MTFGDGAGSEPVAFPPRGGLVRLIFHVEIETRDREGFALVGDWSGDFPRGN
jgi:hypothetical protein